MATKDKNMNLTESDLAQDKMGNNALQGNDQSNTRNQRQAVPDVKLETEKHLTDADIPADMRRPVGLCSDGIMLLPRSRSQIHLNGIKRDRSRRSDLDFLGAGCHPLRRKRIAVFAYCPWPCPHA